MRSNERANERARERGREIYYCHHPNSKSSNREQMGICSVYRNKILLLFNYFIIILINIFGKKCPKKNF